MPVFDWLNKNHALKAAAFAEGDTVVVRHDIETEEGLVKAGTRGVVVSVYVGGTSCAVEIQGLSGGMAVVFVAVDSLVGECGM